MAGYSGLIWLVLLLLGNAFFVGAEFAVISARRSQIEPRAERGSKAAKTTLFAMEHVTLMLATSQLGITVCSLLILNVSEPAIHHLFGALLQQVGVGTEAIAIIAFFAALIVVTYLHVVFGEMVPKNLSFSVPDRAALMLAPPLVAVARLVKLAVVGLNAAANAVVRLFGVEPKDEATSEYTLEQVATIVDESTREGTVQDNTGALSAVTAFPAKTVADLAVPLDQLVLLPRSVSPAQLQQVVIDHGYSRYVLTDPTGAPVGYLHLKDVLDLADPARFQEPVPQERIRPLIHLESSIELDDALAALRRAGSHVALVHLPAAAGTGAVFLEDILEELVGEIDDITSA